LQQAIAQDLHKAGVIAQRAERYRKKRVAMLTKARANIPDEILEPIVDPEAIIDEAIDDIDKGIIDEEITDEENEEGYKSESNSEHESYNESNRENDGDDSNNAVIIV
jgi:hypothetical protein